MKTVPTDLDREAGRLFRPDPAMRLLWTKGRASWERVADCTAHTGKPFAFDTDDAATVGCMESQILATFGALPDVWGVHYHCDGGWVVEAFDSHYYGPTKGAALVAAMKKIKGEA